MGFCPWQEMLQAEIIKWRIASPSTKSMLETNETCHNKKNKQKKKCCFGVWCSHLTTWLETRHSLPSFLTVCPSRSCLRRAATLYMSSGKIASPGWGACVLRWCIMLAMRVGLLGPPSDLLMPFAHKQAVFFKYLKASPFGCLICHSQKGVNSLSTF